MNNGNKEIFINGVVGIVGALGNDGAGNLLALDGAGKKLFRINPKNLAISIVAENLPVGYSFIGSYPPVGFAMAMSISPKGDIYIPTVDQGLIRVAKDKVISSILDTQRTTKIPQSFFCKKGVEGFSLFFCCVNYCILS